MTGFLFTEGLLGSLHLHLPTLMSNILAAWHLLKVLTSSACYVAIYTLSLPQLLVLLHATWDQVLVKCVQ